MRVVAVFKERSDHARQMTDFIRDVERQTGKIIDSLDPETREGSDFCQLHDIVEYPSLVALDDDGRQLTIWRGRTLPSINEVVYYVS